MPSQASQLKAQSFNLRPDDLLEFRLARLLLLFKEAHALGLSKPLDLERVGYYDFFSGSPFLVFGEDEATTELVLAGFDSRNLSYASSAQRFTNRRARLQHDISILTSLGLAEAKPEAGKVVYSATGSGLKLATKFLSLYASSYIKSSKLILRKLNRLSDLGLRNKAKDWLSAKSFLIDIYDVEM